MEQCIVISVGGSMISLDSGPDREFLKRLRETLLPHIGSGKKFVLVSGGGRVCRQYIDAARSVTALVDDDLDWLGIHATRLNGHLLRTILRDVAEPIMYKNPLAVPEIGSWRGNVLIAAGWKPGWSTDYVACRIAKRLGSTMVINLSNIDKVYTDDPRKNPDAKPMDEMSWKDYRAMVGDEWSPGLSAPFDPIASKFCHKNKIEVVILNGGKIERLQKFLESGEVEGTALK